MESIHVRRDEYEITTDKQRLDIGHIHDFLANRSYWARNIPHEVVKRSIEHSLCFGLFYSGRQVGFARAVTDFATFAYLADVFIDEGYRGAGLGKWLVGTILDHPGLAGLRMIALGTRDAHGLYERFGFINVGDTELTGRLMVIRNPDPYNGRGS
jgi:GNAT superfamily N-acetyltransferase